MARDATDRDGHARHRDHGDLARPRREGRVRARTVVRLIRVHSDARPDYQLASGHRYGVPRLAGEGPVGHDRIYRRALPRGTLADPAVDEGRHQPSAGVDDFLTGADGIAVWIPRFDVRGASA